MVQISKVLKQGAASLGRVLLLGPLDLLFISDPRLGFKWNRLPLQGSPSTLLPHLKQGSESSVQY